MIFDYPITGKTETISVDTDDLDFIQRADKIRDKVGATKWTVQPVSVYSWAPDALPSYRGVRGQVLFYGLPSTTLIDGVFSSDALAVLKLPEATLQDIVIGANLKVDFDVWAWKFEDPDDVKPALDDWQQPNAIIGPPLESMPAGYFHHKGGKQALGSTWTGASGKVYKVVLLPSLFAAYAWKAQ